MLYEQKFGIMRRRQTKKGCFVRKSIECKVGNDKESPLKNGAGILYRISSSARFATRNLLDDQFFSVLDIESLRRSLREAASLEVVELMACIIRLQ